MVKTAKSPKSMSCNLLHTAYMINQCKKIRKVEIMKNNNPYHRSLDREVHHNGNKPVETGYNRCEDEKYFSLYCNPVPSP